MSEGVSSAWRRDDAHNGRVIFKRPMGATELKFYWDTVFYGTATAITHLELDVEASYEQAMFSKENVELAWLRMKQRFPMLAASADELPESEVVEFVIDERVIHSNRPGEVVLVDHLESVEDVARFNDELQNGEPMLDNKIIAKLWIGPQKDKPRRYHAFIAVVHYITDGMAGAAVMRELCQELSSLSKEGYKSDIPLAKRLSVLLPLEDLNPNNKLSLPRRRWRLAAAKVILELRMANIKGGHTLPALPSPGFGIPALSRTERLRLPASISQQVIRNCRALGITFGNALPVLSQLAHTRILHRRRANASSPKCTQISDAEWAYRRVQPMRFSGPLNLRPYLDRKWYEAGGASEVCLAISFYDLALPFMPSPEPLHQQSHHCVKEHQPQTVARWLMGSRDLNTYLADEYVPDSDRPLDEDEDGTPSFSALLSHQRFLARALMVRTQSSALLRHPLLQEIHAARMPKFHSWARTAGLAWRAKRAGKSDASIEVPSTFNVSTGVFSNGGASIGNRDLIFPSEYPIPSPSMSPAPIRLRVQDSITHLRCRPGELYLGAITTRGEMSFFSYADANLYEPDLVKEWMEEVRAATVFYLGSGVDSSLSDRIAKQDALHMARL